MFFRRFIPEDAEKETALIAGILREGISSLMI